MLPAHRQIEIATATRHPGKKRLIHVQMASRLKALAATGCALRRNSAASISGVGFGSGILKVEPSGTAFCCKSLGIARFVPQYGQGMWVFPASGLTGAPQAMQGNVFVSAMACCVE